jgi:streptomycin 6-kinase
MPENLIEAAKSEGRSAWLDTLPVKLKDMARRWSLSVGQPFQLGGQTAWVAPARRAAGDDVVLKLAWRHPEAAHEADGLREWNGDGTVRLLADEEFDDTIAMLIERCPEPRWPGDLNRSKTPWSRDCFAGCGESRRPGIVFGTYNYK